MSTPVSNAEEDNIQSATDHTSNDQMVGIVAEGLLKILDPETQRRITGLNRQGAFPIPWAAKYVNGIAEFRQNDSDKVKLSAQQHKCAVCGESIGKRESRWFIGGPSSLANTAWTDPWMHSGCARYSASACVFLSGRRQTYRGNDLKYTIPADTANDMMNPESGPYLVEAKKSGIQTLVRGTHKFLIFRAYEVGQIIDISTLGE